MWCPLNCGFVVPLLGFISLRDWQLEFAPGVLSEEGKIECISRIGTFEYQLILLSAVIPVRLRKLLFEDIGLGESWSEQITPSEAQLQNPGPMPIQVGLKRRVRKMT